MTARPFEPGAVATVVDYLRSGHDLVAALGGGAFKFNSEQEEDQAYGTH